MFSPEMAEAIQEEVPEDGFVQVGLLLSNEHGWEVRRLDETEDEMRKVAQIQAEAFYEPPILFHDLFFEFFQVLNIFIKLTGKFSE